MSTTSIARFCKAQEEISQGDVFVNVKYNYIDSEDDTYASITEYNFPMAIIISQACDVIAMESTVKNRAGKPNKFMPSILMCPIYDFEDINKKEHLEQVYTKLSYQLIPEFLYNKHDRKVAKNDWHYRFHALDVKVGENKVLEHAVIDFKHYFTVPMSYLYQHKDDRLFQLENVFAEQVTLKFTVFLSRVAVPDETEEGL